MSQWVFYSVLLTECQWTNFSLMPHIGHQNVMGCNRFGPANGFYLRLEEICHTETQHCYTFLKFIPLQKKNYKQNKVWVCMHKYISQVKLQVTTCFQFKIIEHNYCIPFLPSLIIYTYNYSLSFLKLDWHFFTQVPLKNKPITLPAQCSFYSWHSGKIPSFVSQGGI